VETDARFASVAEQTNGDHFRSGITDAHYDRKLIEKLFTEASGAKTVVIDLRGNGGGNADNTSHLLDMILPSGTKLGTFVEKADVKRFTERFQREARNLAELVEYGEMTIAARSVFENDSERFRKQFQRAPQSMAELVEFVGPKSMKHIQDGFWLSPTVPAEAEWKFSPKAYRI
jgi:hypothetical protein